MYYSKKLQMLKIIGFSVIAKQCIIAANITSPTSTTTTSLGVIQIIIEFTDN